MDWHEGFRRIRLWHCAFLYLVPMFLDIVLQEYLAVPRWSQFENQMYLYPFQFSVFVICAAIILRDIGLPWTDFLGAPSRALVLPVFVIFPLSIGLFLSVLGIQVFVADRLMLSSMAVPEIGDETATGEFCFLSQTTRWEYAVMFFSRGVLGPIQEELFFRGFLLAWLLCRFGAPLAILLTSVLFGLAHGMERAPPRVSIGCINGASRVIFRTLWIPIALHIAHNGVYVSVAVECLRVLMLPLDPVTDVWFYLLLFMLAVVGLVCSILLIARRDQN